MKTRQLANQLVKLKKLVAGGGLEPPSTPRIPPETQVSFEGRLRRSAAVGRITDYANQPTFSKITHSQNNCQGDILVEDAE